MSEDVGSQEFVLPEDIGVRKIVLELVIIIKNFGFPVFDSAVSFLLRETENITTRTVVTKLVNIEGKYDFNIFYNAIRYIYQYTKEVQSYVQQHAGEIQSHAQLLEKNGSYVQQHAEYAEEIQRQEEKIRRCVQKLIDTPEVLFVDFVFYQALGRICINIDKLSCREFNNLVANIELVSDEMTLYTFKEFMEILDEIQRKYCEKNYQLGRESCHQDIHEQYEIRLRNLVRQLSDEPPVLSKMFCDMLNMCVENLENLSPKELRNIIKGMHSVADAYGNDILDYLHDIHDKFNRRLAELEGQVQSCMQQLTNTTIKALPANLVLFYEALNRIFENIAQLSSDQFNNLFANLEVVAPEMKSSEWKACMFKWYEIQKQYYDLDYNLKRRPWHQDIHNQYLIRIQDYVNELSDEPPVLSKMYCDMLGIYFWNVEKLSLEKLRNIIKGMHSVADRYGNDLLDYWSDFLDKCNRRFAELEKVQSCVQQLTNTIIKALPANLVLFYEALNRIFENISQLSPDQFNNLFANLEVVAAEMKFPEWKACMFKWSEIQKQYYAKGYHRKRRPWHQTIHNQYLIRIKDYVNSSSIELSDEPPVLSKMYCDMLNICFSKVEKRSSKELRDIIKGMHSAADRYGNDLLDYWSNLLDKFNRQLAELEKRTPIIAQWFASGSEFNRSTLRLPLDPLDDELSIDRHPRGLVFDVMQFIDGRLLRFGLRELNNIQQCCSNRYDHMTNSNPLTRDIRKRIYDRISNLKAEEEKQRKKTEAEKEQREREEIARILQENDVEIQALVNKSISGVSESIGNNKLFKYALFYIARYLERFDLEALENIYQNIYRVESFNIINYDIYRTIVMQYESLKNQDARQKQMQPPAITVADKLQKQKFTVERLPQEAPHEPPAVAEEPSTVVRERLRLDCGF